ncbi:zinc finger protein ZFAT isoform X1 [Patella vulgata]|uniref:zinc finger protein ZFAT isoform X1 n=1 Tax=Patella vulgata TaxID=6465 RepID=UPI00217F560E|nr:zinc finger protein ZFAT isoform X1 [Patella vulgata]XP_050398945.1 zinc finger protein ZFAT isoform X1 [Patella vulgata]
MPLDTFICGNCQGAFCDIEAFMNHKKSTCLQEEPTQTAEVIQVRVSGEVTSLDEATAIPLVSVGEAATNTSLTFYSEADVNSSEAVSGETTKEQTLVILNDDYESIDSHLTSDKGTSTVDMETEEAPKVKKKGRPKSKKKTEVVVKKETGRPPLPERGSDGRFTCVRCKRSFIKDRYFNTHKCLSDDYVDITKKEVFSMGNDDDDDDVHDAGEIDDEDIDEYTAPVVVTEDPDEDVDIDPKTLTKTIVKNNKDNAKPTKLDKIQIISDPDLENSVNKKITDAIEDIPVFKNDAEKLNFEASVNIDLSGMDGMFTKHSIEQDLVESVGGNGKNISSELSLYMCNICSKVFKTLSHIRLHCLIHTDLKPFKCPHCEYASNSKGNLYTHMRRHTGQFYVCQKCPFHSVNKSHLIEHEATHNNTRYLCNLCKKDYNTQKSLVNHIRKYHCDSQKGKDYLAIFLNKRTNQSQTVIHQCHVCNRKFKKKIDRDRHLFVHDIKDIPNIQRCELCDYTASRKVYLEKHYLKHRVIYCCFSCPQRFLSSVRLIDHLNSNHLNNDASTTWETLFEQCIENSIYLPEPDDQIRPGSGSDILNLPPELSKTSLELSDANKKLASLEVNATSTTVTPALHADAALPLVTDLSSTDAPSTILDPASNQNEELMETDSPLVINSITDNLLQSSTQNDESAEPVVHSDVSVEPVEPCKVSTEPVVSSQVDSLPINKGVDDTETSLLKEASQMAVEVAGPDNEDSKIENNDNTTITIEGSDIGETIQNNLNVEGDELPMEEDISESLNVISEVEAEGSENESAAKIDMIIAKLGYREMSMDIFHKMRETFGSEECEYCGRLFYSKADFEAHQRIHTGERPFHCEHCQFKAMNSNVLKKHVEKEHPTDNTTYKCTDCDFTTTTRNMLWSHRIKHLAVVGLQCPKCPDKFESMKQLRTHLLEKHPYIEMEELEKLTGYKHRLHGKMGRRSYKCPYCERIFMKANAELQKHIWMHEGIKPFKCAVCTYSCRSKNNLQAHMLRHSAEKPFHCEECGKLYKSRTALRWHVRSHKDGKMFKCSKCSYEAAQRSHLKRHMETHDVLKRYACQECDYTANTIQFMKIHYARNHKGVKFETSVSTEAERNEQNLETKVFKCVSCDYLFGNMSELKRHLRVRHQVQVQDIAKLESSMETCEVQVVQYVDEGQEQSEITTTELTQIEEIQEQSVETEGQLDEKTVSAVSLLQQIIDMSNQGAFNQQHLTVLNEEGQMVAVNPDTIIVQEDGQEVLVSDGNTELDGSQYVIQYVSQQDAQLDGIPEEIQTTEEMQTQ